MSWNYRVIKITEESGEESYGIHEVYYDSSGRPHMYSEQPCPLYSETLEGLEKEISRFEGALGRPVLTPDDFKTNPEEASPSAHDGPDDPR